MMVEERQAKDFGDYIKAFRRRRTQMLAIGGILIVVAMIIALAWPAVYRSTATILIEEQEIPVDLVRSTVTSYAAQRIQMISQRVMSRTNLMEIINKYDLYVSERRRETTEEIVERMRGEIALDMINAEVVDPRSGRPTAATIAFSLSYEGKSPTLTQKVANELTSLYLSENIKNRTEKASETYGFLSEEAKKLNEKITELEAKLAEFKEKNLGSLPELADLNMSMMDRTERELLEADREFRSMEERKFFLETQLAELDPYRPMVSDTGQSVLNPSSRLEMLRSEYTNAKVKYAPDHPDVIRLKREIEGLELQLGESSSENGINSKGLAEARAQLAAAKEKYSPDHPDVIRLTEQVAGLEATIIDSKETKTGIKADNPAYIQLQSQLDSIKSGVEALRIKRQGLRGRLKEYEERVKNGPKIEQEYRILRRDYENATRRYQEIKGKQMEAEIAQELEKESKGERFSLIDPAQLPESPIKPNRPVILFLGFVLSMGCAIGFVLIMEAIDMSVRGSKGVEQVIGMAPLAIIPYRENNSEIIRRARVYKYTYVSVIVAVILAIIVIHFFWTPLDVLWFRGLRKVDTVVGS